MAIYSTTAFTTMFGDEVTHVAQQTASNLQGAVRTVRGVVGSTYKFPVMGKAGYVVNKPAGEDLDVMSSTAYGSITTTANTGTTTEYKVAGTSPASMETATLRAYATGEYADNVEQLFTNVDLRSAYAESIAASMNRAYDQVIIDALDAAHTEGGLALDILGADGATTGTGADINRGTLTAAHKALTENNVPMGDRYFVISPNGLNHLLADTNLISSQDGPLSNALVTGQVANVMGFNIIVSSQLSAGVTNTGDKMGFAFHKNALGMAVGKDITTEVNYVPEKLATLISAQFSAGATAIDNTAIVAVEINE